MWGGALDPYYLVSLLVYSSVSPFLESLYFVVTSHRYTTYGSSAPLTSVYSITNLRFMAPRTKKAKEFDEAVLQSMTEPISVSLWKIVAGKKSPIELPPGPGETIGGQGFTQNMLRQFSAFVSNQWSGGGMYDCAATGANGEQMKWEMFFPPNKIPELTPPTQNQSSAASQQPNQPAPSPVAQGYAASGSGDYLNQVAQTYYQQPNQPPFAGQPAAGMTPPVNPYAWQQPRSPQGIQIGQGPSPSPYQRPPDMSAVKEREERLKLEAKMERQAQQAQHEKDMAAITGELRRVQEQISKGPSTEESSALRQAMDKIAALEQQGSTQVLMQQMQQMQSNTAQLITQMKSDTEKQIEAIRRDSESNKADPMLPMLMQVMQQQGTATQQSMQTFVQFMQASQTAQVEAARIAQSAQMGPREMIDLVRSANQGQDHMAAGYGKMQDMWMHSMEAIMGSQPQGVHPAIAMLGSGVEGGLGIAQQYLEMKQNETQANAQARNIQSQMEAQARVRAAQVQAQAQAHAAETVPVDPGASEGEEPGEEEDTESPQEHADDVEVIAAAPTQDELIDKEQQLFGEALPHVTRLRKGVGSGAISTMQCAAIVLQAVDHFGSAAAGGAELPPVFALFQEERFPELIDTLIPAARSEFRDEATAALFAGVQNLKKQAGMMSNTPPEQPQPVG